MTQCQRCTPGTWSDMQEAASEDVCTPCPLGTWSAQEGSPTSTSCRGCPAGTWGSRQGLGSSDECSKCQAGTWTEARGATSDAVCSPCAAGTWSSVPGASSAMTCIACSKGTWSTLLGASDQSNCTQCAEGTWSDRTGAEDASTCTACPAGTFQPALGQASQRVCIWCIPGKFSSGGASVCSACPAGTWSSSAEATTCNACPAGTWTHSAGALDPSDCRPCSGSECGATDLHITAMISGVNWATVSSEDYEALKLGFAREIASVCGVVESSVVDLYGRNSSVAISAAGEVNTFVLHSASCTSGELKAKLSSRTFWESLMQVVGPSWADAFGSMIVSTVSVELQSFVAMASTTQTSTTTSSSASTLPASGSDDDAAASTTTAQQASSSAAKDMNPNAEVDSSAGGEGDKQQNQKQAEGGVPTWVWGIVGGAVVAAVALLWHCISARRQRKEGADIEVGERPFGQQPSAKPGSPERVEGNGAEDAREGDLTLSNMQGPRSLSAPNFLRTTMSDVDEGDLHMWFDGELRTQARPEYDCTKGCTAWC